jgi:hypothetical protein
MHGIYSYVPETNCVFGVCRVAAILYLQFMVCVVVFPMINILYVYINAFRSMCVVPNMVVSYNNFYYYLCATYSDLHRCSVCCA